VTVRHAFRRTRRGEVELTLRPEEAGVLADLLDQLADLVAPEEPPDADPLNALVGIGTQTRPPDDPALARLFPSAYPDDDAAAGEFRRYTEPDLRTRKREQALAARASLERVERGSVRLTPDEATGWLLALNDLRLVYGVRLEVSDDEPVDLADLEEDDPRLLPMALYQWLTYLQATLIEALGGPA
jgi:hypothetical protein